jgi:hypothetical protein
MIQISATLALTLYLSLFLLTLLLLWILHNKKKMKSLKIEPLTKLFVCEFCKYPYLDKSSKKITECPQCKSFNKENDYKKGDKIL